MSNFNLQGGRIDDLAAHMDALADTIEEQHEAKAQATREELQAMQTERRKLSEGVAELSRKLGEQIDAQRREKMEAEAERKKAEITEKLRAEAAHHGRAEWNESESDKGLKSMLHGLNLHGTE